MKQLYRWCKSVEISTSLRIYGREGTNWRKHPKVRVLQGIAVSAGRQTGQQPVSRDRVIAAKGEPAGLLLVDAVYLVAVLAGRDLSEMEVQLRRLRLEPNMALRRDGERADVLQQALREI